MLHIGGHPKALEILAGYLDADLDRLPGLLEQFDEAVGYVEDGLASEHQERGRKLLIDAVLAGVPEERLPALDRLCLLQAPLPDGELVELLAATGVADPRRDLAWLRRHGLLARTVAPSALEGGDAVHRLIASRRQESLAEREGEEVAGEFHRAVADHLVKPGKPLSNLGLAAGHLDASGDRAGALKLFNRWALTLRERHAYRACEQVARRALAEMPPDDSEAARVAAAQLLIRVHDGLQPLGELRIAESALEDAEQRLAGLASKDARFLRAGVQMHKASLLAGRGEPELALEAFEAAKLGFSEAGAERESAIALGGAARLRAQAGDVQGALKLHQEELEVYEKLGDVRSRAVTLGDVARLRAQAGDVQGALKLYQEILEVYEKLGDVRSRAITLGDVAGLRAQAGDVQGARKYQEERLATNRQLGDVDGIAAALFDLANIDIQEQKLSDAISKLAEAFPVFVRIGRADGIAIVGKVYGQLLAAAERPEASEVLERSRQAFELLGRTDQARQVGEILAGIQGRDH